MLWRPYLSGISTVADFYTKRNLWALSIIFNGILRLSTTEQKDLILLAFSGALYNASMMYQERDEGGGPAKGIYYVPPIFREVSGWKLLSTKLANIEKAAELWTPKEQPQAIVSTQSAVDLSQICDNSIDYIFTDPPYSWKVQYGESNFLWESWLRLDTNWHSEEVIINDFRGKSKEEWASSLTRSMEECYRVLKPGHWLSLCYHDSSEGTWDIVQQIIGSVGFVVDDSGSALFIETGQKAWKQTVADKVTKRDLVINLRKPKHGETQQIVQITGEEDELTFQEKVRQLIQQHLALSPGTTKDRIYDEVVSHMVRNGQMQSHNFEELLLQVADEVKEPVMENLFEQKKPDLFGSHQVSRWYLKDTEEGSLESDRTTETAAGCKD